MRAAAGVSWTGGGRGRAAAFVLADRAATRARGGPGGGVQSVVAPQRLQERRTLSLVAQTSASTLVSSIFSRAPQELQRREVKPSCFSISLMGGKSISQKLRFWSKKAAP